MADGLLGSGGALDPAAPVAGLGLLGDAKPPSPFKEGLGAGVAGVKASLYGAGALAARGIGAMAKGAGITPVADLSGSIERSALENVQAQNEIAAPLSRGYEDVDWTSPGSVANHYKYLLGSAVPSLGLMFAGGVAGRGLGALGARAAGVTGTAARTAAATTGMNVGAVLPDVALEAGSIYPEALKSGVENPGIRSIVGGSAAAALDFIPLLAAERYLGAAGKGGARAILKAAAKGAPIGAALEGAQEVGQSVIERAAAGVPLTGPKATSDYIDSLLGGAAPGLLFGAGVGGLHGRAAKQSTERITPPLESTAPAAASIPAEQAPVMPEQTPFAAAPATGLELEQPAVEPALVPKTTTAEDLWTEHNALADQHAGLSQAVAQATQKVEALSAEIGAMGRRVPKAAKEGLTTAKAELATAQEAFSASAERVGKLQSAIQTQEILDKRAEAGLTGREVTTPPTSAVIETAPAVEPTERAVQGVRALMRENGIATPGTYQENYGAIDFTESRAADTTAAPSVEPVVERGTLVTKTVDQKTRQGAIETAVVQSVAPNIAAVVGAKNLGEGGKVKLTRVLTDALNSVAREAAALPSSEAAQAHIMAEVPKALKGRVMSVDAEEVAKTMASAVDRAHQFYSKGAASPHYLNVGLSTAEVAGPGTSITPTQVTAALAKIGVKVLDHVVHQSNTEATMVPRLSRGLTNAELNQLALDLKQQAIPQYSNGVGIMEGPMAAAWGAFDPTQFKMPDGRWLSEHQQSNAALTQDEFDTLSEPAKFAAVDEFNKHYMAVGTELRQRLTQLLGNPPGLVVKTFMATPDSPIGSYTRLGPQKAVIAMALNAKNGPSLANHEGYHYAEDWALSTSERTIVANTLKEGRPLYNQLIAYAQQYDRENKTAITDEIRSIPAEARAYGFEFWAQGKLQPEGALARVWAKLRQFFERIANAVNGLGFQSIEDVFTALDRGQYAERATLANGMTMAESLVDSDWANDVEPDVVPGHTIRNRTERAASKAKGRPYWVENGADVARMRQQIRKLALEGQVGRNWHANSAQAILEWAKGDVKLAAQMAALISNFSPRTPVGLDLKKAFTAFVQFEGKQPIEPGAPKEHIDGARRILFGQEKDGSPVERDAAGNIRPTGIKRENFFKNLMLGIDPKNYNVSNQGATIDMWMAHAFGFANDVAGSVDKSQYNYADAEVKRLAQELGWGVEEAQAAIWVAIKARGNAARSLIEKHANMRGWYEMVPDAKAGYTEDFVGQTPNKYKRQVKSMRQREFVEEWMRMANINPIGEDQIAKANYDYAQAFADIYSGKIDISDRLDSLPFEITKPAAQDEYAMGYQPSLFSQGAVQIAGWTPERVSRLLKQYGYTMDPLRSKAYAGMISPQEFLSLTASKEMWAQIQRETKPLDTEQLAKESQELFLDVRPIGDVSGGVFNLTGHEGRHRMVALARAGVAKVPVILNLKDGQQLPELGQAYLIAQSGAQGRVYIESPIPVSVANRAKLEAMGSGATVQFSRAALALSPAQDRFVTEVSKAKTADEALASLIATTQNPAYKEIASRIKGELGGAKFFVVEPGVKIPGGVPTALATARGVFMLNREKGMNGIWVKGLGFGDEHGMNEMTVLHELLHAATARKIGLGVLEAANGEVRAATHDLIVLGNQIVAEYNRRFKELGKSPVENEARMLHALKDPKELVAMGMTDPSVQAFLKSVQVPGERKTLWNNFVEAVRRLLGIDPSSNDALSSLIEVTDRIITAKKSAAVIALENALDPRMVQRNPIDDPNKVTFTHWGNVPGGQTIPEMMGRGVKGADQRVNAAMGVTYTSAVIRGSDYFEPAVQSRTEYVGQLDRDKVYQARNDDPLFAEAKKDVMDQYGPSSSHAWAVYMRKVRDMGYDAMEFGGGHLRIFTSQRVEPAMTQTLFSQAAAEMETRKTNGELEREQFSDAIAKLYDQASIPRATTMQMAGAAGNQVVGGLQRFRLKYLATGNYISRFSQGYANVQKALLAYVQRKATLIAQGSLEQLSEWHSGSTSQEDITAVGKVLLQRTEKSLTVESAELRGMLSELTEHQRKMFQQATDMIAGRLNHELAVDTKAMVQLLPGKEFSEWLDARTTQVQKLIAEGYVPERRYGDYTVHVTLPRKDGGKALTVHYEMFESQAAADVAAARYREILAKEAPDLAVDVGYKYKVERDASISIQQFMDTARRTGIELTQAERERLAKALVSADSMRRNRMFRRENISGYSKDIMRVLHEFVVTTANKVAYGEFSTAINDAIDGKPVDARTENGVPATTTDAARNLWKEDGPKSGFFRNLSDELTDYVLVPDHGGNVSRKLRGAAMTYFIGGSIASGAVNMMSIPMNVVPWLSQSTGYANATATTLGALKLTLANIKAVRDLPTLKDPSIALPDIDKVPGLRLALITAAEDGRTMDTEIHQIMGMAQGATYAHSRTVQKAMDVWMSPFKMTEQVNRIATFIAAYKVGQSNNLSGRALYDFAAGTVDNTQNRYDEVNRPGMARNQIGAMLFMFKSFPLFMVEMVETMFRQNPKSAVYMLLGLTAMTGVNGLPFAEAIQDIIDTIAQKIFGSPFNTRRAMRNLVKDASEAIVGADLSEVVLRGIINDMTGLSMASRIGMGDFIPGTRIGAADSDYGKVAEQLLGAPASMVVGAGSAAGKVLKGDLVGAIRAGGPAALRNLVKAGEQIDRGYAEDAAGRKLVNVSGPEAFWQALGFSSASLNKMYELDKIDKQQNAFYVEVRKDFTNHLVRALKDGNAEAAQETFATMKAWNESNPEMPVMLSPATIRRDIMLAGMPLNARTLAMLPKQLRGSSVSAEAILGGQ